MTEEENHEDEEDEEVDVEILEFALGNEEIDEFISKLNELKQTKKSIEFEIDDENELLIHHEENEELENEDEEEDLEEESNDKGEENA
jgi:hypothetical protein